MFLAIALMHVLPEQVGLYADLKGKGVFPLPFMLAMIGYTLILLIDKIMFNAQVILDQNEKIENKSA